MDYSNRLVQSVTLKLGFFGVFLAALQNYWTLWRRMAAQRVTVPIGEDRRRTQVLSQKTRAKNLGWLILPKASLRSRWKVCKGEKELDLCSTVFHLHVSVICLIWDGCFDVLFFFFLKRQHCILWFCLSSVDAVMSKQCCCHGNPLSLVLYPWEIALWIRYQVTVALSNYRPWDGREK